MKMAIGASADGFFEGYADSFHTARRAGFRCIDFSFIGFQRGNPQALPYMRADWAQDMRRIRAEMEAAEVVPVQAHGPFCYPMPPEAYAPLTRAIERAVECCPILGIDRLVVHPHAEAGMTHARFLEENRRLFRQFIPAMEATGVSLCVENIGTPLDPHFVHDGAELLHLIEAIDHPMVHACWDVGHANTNMEDQRGSIRTLGSHLWCLHVHDNLGDLGALPRQYYMDFHTLPYLGNVHYDAVIQALLEIGYPGVFTFETAVPRPGSGFRPQLDMPADSPVRIMQSPRFMLERMLSLAYEVGRYMLEAYGCFEA